MSRPFFDGIEVSGGEDIVAAFKKLERDIQISLVERVADETLGRIAEAMRAEVGSLRTRTDEPYTGKGGDGRKWPYIRKKRPATPGMARTKVSSSIAVIPLGSQQRRLYVGKRIGVTGKSGAFYGRLMEKGFMVRRKGRMRGWVKSDTKIPGKWMFLKLFKRLQPGAEAQAVAAFTEFIRDWTAPAKSKSSGNIK
jgi:hypothetical protein